MRIADIFGRSDEDYKKQSEKKGVIEYLKDPKEKSTEMLLPGFYSISKERGVYVLKKTAGVWQIYNHPTDYKLALQTTPLELTDRLHKNEIITALKDPIVSQNFQYAEISKAYQKQAIQYALETHPALERFEIRYTGVKEPVENHERIKRLNSRFPAVRAYVGHWKYDFEILRVVLPDTHENEKKKEAITKIEEFVETVVDKNISQIMWRVRWLDILHGPTSGKEIVYSIVTNNGKKDIISVEQIPEIKLEEILEHAKKCIIDTHAKIKPYAGVKAFKKLVVGKYVPFLKQDFETVE